MTSSGRVVLALILTAVLTATTGAQRHNLKVDHFEKDGVTFSYPNGWAFSDSSSAAALDVTFGNPDLDANLTVTVSKAFTARAKLAAAKSEMVDKYIAAMTSSYASEGKAVRSASTSQIGGVRAAGVKLRVLFKGVPGTVEIEWAVIRNRLVVLTLRGPEAAYLAAGPTWDMVRATIKI